MKTHDIESDRLNLHKVIMQHVDGEDTKWPEVHDAIHRHYADVQSGTQQARAERNRESIRAQSKARQ